MTNTNNYFIQWEDGSWGHRPPIKRIINTILRGVQFFTNKPYLIWSQCEVKDNRPIRFIKYHFGRITLKNG
jgi:hypothetical protein